MVLNAGAGYGKTMLLAFYAQKSEQACAWYHLDSMDNDIVSFIQYLTYSITSVLPNFEFHLDDYQNMDIDHEFARNIGYDLAYQLSCLDEELVIILDDFQKIHNEDIFNIISILISHTKEQVRLMLSMKSAFPKFLARYLLQGTAMVVSSKELAFNKDEIIYILQDIPNLSDIDEIAETVLGCTEGWPVVVMSSVLGIKQERKMLNKHDITMLCKESAVYDYIMYEVYRKLPYDIQLFLKNSSVLTLVSANICNAIMNINNAQNILDYLVQENLFVVKLSGAGHIYQYHSIFKEFLRSFMTEEMKKEVYQKAARYCISTIEYQEQAADYAILSDNCSIVQDIIEIMGLSMVHSGKLTTLKRWIEYLVECKCLLSATTNYVIANYYQEEKHYKQANYYLEEAAELFMLEQKEEGYAKAILKKVDIISIIEHESAALSYLLEEESKQANPNALIKLTFGLKKAELYLLSGKIDSTEQICEELHHDILKSMEKGEYYSTLVENLTLIIRYFVHKREGIIVTYSEEELIHIRENFLIFYDFYNWVRTYDYYINKQTISLLEGTLLKHHEDNRYVIHMKLLSGLTDWKSGNKEIGSDLINHCTDYYESNKIDIPLLSEEDKTILLHITNVKLQVGEQNKNELKICCFGAFHVYMNGIEVKWRTKKAKEMFAYLFDKNGKAVDREVITEALWPESFYSNAKSIFHTTLSYLRKALSVGGYQDIIILKNKKYYIDMSMVHVDNRDFLKVFDDIINEKWEEIDRSQDLLTMYTGEYLADIDCEWNSSRKEKFERLFLKACRVLAEHNINNKKYEVAVNYLVRALDIDPYSENLAALLIRCYGALGDIKRVKLQYEKTRQILYEELNVELSEEMNLAYKESINHMPNRSA